VKRTVAVTLTLALCAALPCLLTGCSGTGAPVEGGDLAALHALANDQLSALLLVKRWMGVLYEPPPDDATAVCRPECHSVPLEPGDPPGSGRTRCTLADCTVLDVLTLADGSSMQVFHYPDGRTATWTWQPPTQQGGWRATAAHAELPDGTQLDYVTAGLPGSPENRQRKTGTATLVSGDTMRFALQREDGRDELDLSPHDGSHLTLDVPLRPARWTYYWPRFRDGSAGTYTSAAGRSSQFRLVGAGNARWEQWLLTGEDGLAGTFTLSEDLGGAGDLRRDGRLLATLSWQASGDGALRPIGAAAVHAVASAAARDFQIDQWIGNIAETGPGPRY